jgi:NADPH:quinone reductase-like Zn-dependent oxidoreductase
VNGICAMGNAALPTSQHLRMIADLIVVGEAKPTIERVFALHEAPRAHALNQTEHGRGRIVLHIAED